MNAFARTQFFVACFLWESFVFFHVVSSHIAHHANMCVCTSTCAGMLCNLLLSFPFLFVEVINPLVLELRSQFFGRGEDPGLAAW
jgi:hypothetical protein